MFQKYILSSELNMLITYTIYLTSIYAYVKTKKKTTHRKEVFSYLYNTIPFHQWEHPTPLTTGDE